MTAATLITLRETLEASLVVGIVLAYLQASGNRRLDRYVWWGVVAGIAASISVALVAEGLFGGFTGRAEEIYEGTTMLVGAGLLTWMILWMLRQGRLMRSHIEGEVRSHVEHEYPWGIFTLTLVSTAREGVETVIFLRATIAHTGIGYHFLGSAIGIATAIVIAFLLFQGVKLVPLRSVFTATSVLLLLFAAGLVAHGVAEFQEAGLLPFLTMKVWDTSVLLPEKGTLGSFAKAIFGYNADPSTLEVSSYLLYLLGISWGWRRIARGQG